MLQNLIVTICDCQLMPLPTQSRRIKLKEPSYHVRHEVELAVAIRQLGHLVQVCNLGFRSQGPDNTPVSSRSRLGRCK